MSTGVSPPARQKATSSLPQVSRTAKPPARQQVAAVCYRVNGCGIEFLLVRTRGDRWTFPKGGLEPGLTHAQTAALEAFEEAGVHGRIEEAAFATYTGRKREGRQRSSATKLAVSAHLCQVLWLGPACESKRSPTWFPAVKAKRRLQEDRTLEDGTEMTRVIDRAVSRIQRLRHATSTITDALQRVQFEATSATGVLRRIQRVSFAPVPPASKLKLLPINATRQTGQLE